MRSHALAGLGRVDRDVVRPGGQHAEHGDDLLGPAREADRHRVAGLDAQLAQAGREAQRAVGQFAVGERARAAEHGDSLGAAAGVLERGRVKRVPR